MVRKLAAGNWKMNGTLDTLTQLKALVAIIEMNEDTDVLICPPATLLMTATKAAASSGIQIGAQDCHAETSGAHTGNISATMIADTGALHVIVGHSERRDSHGETDADIRAKATAATASGLTAIICIGESEAERLSGDTLEVLGQQLAASCPDTARSTDTVIAYEPIWAIGTGKVPSLAQITEVHDFLRDQLSSRFGPDGAEFRLLYGGSVKPDNAAEIFKARNVNGALVGGASLKAADFAPIITALQSS